MIKAAIFDLDGTLLDTLKDIALAMNSVLDSHGFKTHPEEKYRYFVGRGIRNLILSSLPGDVTVDDELLEECHTEMREEYIRRQEDHTCPYEGITDMLDGLREQNIRMAILSNKPHEMTQKIVASLLGDYYFEQIIGARKGLPVKPDPYAIGEIREHMGLELRDYLYIGDTDTDMQTAQAAGLQSVGVLWGFREREELETAGAHHIISHPAELLDLVRKLNQ